MGLFKDITGSLARFHRGRLIMTLHELDPDAYRVEASRIFDEGKKLSDFVGIIVRFAFAQAAVSYFLHKAPLADGIKSYILGFCAVSAIGITLAIGVRVFWIILFYEARDLRNAHAPWVRRILVVFAVFHTFVLWYGIRTLVDEIAATALK